MAGHASLQGFLPRRGFPFGMALSGKQPAGSEGFGVGCGHGSDLLSPASFSAGRHPVSSSLEGVTRAQHGSVAALLVLAVKDSTGMTPWAARHDPAVHSL
jgi:hypothetical protein